MLRTCAIINKNHLQLHSAVDLVMQLDDQLLDLVVLNHPPGQVVVGWVNEVRAPTDILSLSTA